MMLLSAFLLNLALHHLRLIKQRWQKNDNSTNSGAHQWWDRLHLPHLFIGRVLVHIRHASTSHAPTNIRDRHGSSKCVCEPTACFSGYLDLWVTGSAGEYKHTGRAATNSQGRIPLWPATKSQTHTLNCVWISLTMWYKCQLKTYGLSENLQGSNKTLMHSCV